MKFFVYPVLRRQSYSFGDRLVAASKGIPIAGAKITKLLRRVGMESSINSEVRFWARRRGPRSNPKFPFMRLSAAGWQRFLAPGVQ